MFYICSYNLSTAERRKSATITLAFAVDSAIPADRMSQPTAGDVAHVLSICGLRVPVRLRRGERHARSCSGSVGFPRAGNTAATNHTTATTSGNRDILELYK
jgi:hypothetical protein